MQTHLKTNKTLTLRKLFRLSFKISFLAIFVLLSCEKEPNISSGPFVLGESNPYVTIEYPDSTELTRSWYFDMDNDGQRDIQFQSYISQSLGGVREIDSRIEVYGFYYEVAALQLSDTLYGCNRYQNNSLIHTVIHNNGSNYVCPNTANYKDSLHSVDTYNYPRAFSKGESLTNNVLWNKDYVSLYYRNSTNLPYNTVSYSILRESSWQDEEKHYLVFRNKELDNGYGWILFKLSGDYGMIYIYEIARPKT